MNRIEEKLLDLFADHSMEEITESSGELLKDALGIRNYYQLSENRDFKFYFYRLKELRDNLDDVLAGEEGMGQVKGALSLLHQKEQQSRKDFEQCMELIKRGIYKKKWSKAQQKYFDFGCQMIGHWKDYFISYTNRNLPETNNDFKDLISEIFGQGFFEENREKSNCVPNIIVHYLEQNGLRGFFDKHNLTCGDVIEDKVFKYCTAVYTFVQIAEMTTFNHDEDKPNWCFREFEKFDEWITKRDMNNYKRYFFILTDEVVFPAVLHKSFKEWKNKISERIYLDNINALDKKQLKRKVRGLAVEIATTKKQILEDYYS